MQVNERAFDLEVPAHHTLLDVLRDDAPADRHEGVLCGRRVRRVHRARRRARGLLVPRARRRDGRRQITTIEGLVVGRPARSASGGVRRQGRRAVRLLHPGHDHVREYLLLISNPQPTEADIQEALVGNLCRCGGYIRIVDAVHTAVGKKSTRDERPDTTSGSGDRTSASAGAIA